MATINEVYGNDYQQRAGDARILHAVRLYVTNMAHKQFTFRNSAPELFNGGNMHPEVVQLMQAQLKELNPDLVLVHVPKTSEDVNMFPYLINGPVEYFSIVEVSKNQTYFLYITPLVMEAY